MAHHDDLSHGPSTRAVHAGQRHRQPHAAITAPISATATYVFDDTAELHRHFQGEISREEYGRYGNPTVIEAERKLAELDGAEACALFGNGMAAIDHAARHAALRQPRRHDVGLLPPHAPVRHQDDGPLRRRGHAGRARRSRRAGGRHPPRRHQAHHRGVAHQPLPARRGPRQDRRDQAAPPRRQAHDRRHLRHPINQRPLELGADLVVHSCTKYLGGHNDLLAGSIAGSEALIGAIRDFRGQLGGVLDPTPPTSSSVASRPSPCASRDRTTPRSPSLDSLRPTPRSSASSIPAWRATPSITSRAPRCQASAAS